MKVSDEKEGDQAAPAAAGSADVKPEKAATEVDSGIESSTDSANSLTVCKLVPLDKSIKLRGPTFWDLGWRKSLCVCNDCVAMYADKECSFLTDETDTCHYYEQQGKAKNTGSNLLERGLSAMNQTMPRTQQVEVIQGKRYVGWLSLVLPLSLIRLHGHEVGVERVLEAVCGSWQSCHRGRHQEVLRGFQALSRRADAGVHSGLLSLIMIIIIRSYKHGFYCT